jgi:hypothetical protein
MFMLFRVCRLGCMSIQVALWLGALKLINKQPYAYVVVSSISCVNVRLGSLKLFVKICVVNCEISLIKPT